MIFMTLTIYSRDLLVIGNQDFPENNLTIQEIRAIFLDKKRFIQEEKILVMNYAFQDPLRQCFEKNILEKRERTLERYWRRAYYFGKRPPKIVSSVEMLFSYLQRVHPSIGYCDSNVIENRKVRILYRIGCDF